MDITFEQVSCSLCSETMQREILAVHKGENCPQRIVTFKYCEFPLPAMDLFEHQVITVSDSRCEIYIICFLSSVCNLRKYVATEQNFAFCATQIIECAKDMAMLKAGVMMSQTGSVPTFGLL